MTTETKSRTDRTTSKAERRHSPTQMPITISMNSVSFPKSEILSHLSRTSHNCGTAIRRMAATETKVRNRRFTQSSVSEDASAQSGLKSGQSEEALYLQPQTNPKYHCSHPPYSSLALCETPKPHSLTRCNYVGYITHNLGVSPGTVGGFSTSFAMHKAASKQSCRLQLWGREPKTLREGFRVWNCPRDRWCALGNPCCPGTSVRTWQDESRFLTIDHPQCDHNATPPAISSTTSQSGFRYLRR